MTTNPLHLGVNIDHVATLRQARGTSYPRPVEAAIMAELAGADSITVHLREDRRHIRERDVELLRPLVRRLNLECARAPEIIEFGLKIRPDLVTLVPERREELTTEGGLDVVSDPEGVAETVLTFQEAGTPVSLFIDPETAQVEAAAATGTQYVELHTGRYADAPDEATVATELEALRVAAHEAARRGLRVNAGHGLRTDNVAPVAAITAVEELSIGHFIMGRALHIGVEAAVAEMREAMHG